MSADTTFAALVNALVVARTADKTTTVYRKAINRISANKNKLIAWCGGANQDWLNLWNDAQREADRRVAASEGSKT